MTNIALPPALEKRRAELQRMIDDLQDRISTHEAGLASARRDISVFAAELNGIDAAAEAFSGNVLTSEEQMRPARKPRRDIRVMVREAVEKAKGP